MLALDLDTRWFQHDGSPQLEARDVDVVADPIPEGPWDLIHERLVLVHIPARLDVLDKLVASLAPGGWIVVEDYDTAEVRTTDRDGPDHELLDRMVRAFNGLLAARGAANSFGANALRHLRDRGLVDTGASGHVVIGTRRRRLSRGWSPPTRVRCGMASLRRAFPSLTSSATSSSSRTPTRSWGARC